MVHYQVSCCYFTVYPQEVVRVPGCYCWRYRLTGDQSNKSTKLVRALSDGAQMFENRLRKNLKQLSRWVKREEIEAYRAYDADLPEYAVAIDCYVDQVVIQEYAPPAKVDPVKSFKRLQEVVAVAGRVFEMSTDKITLKQRKRQAGSDQYEREDSQGQTFVVTEYGCKFEVNLRDYLDTGLFLDHRPVRKQIQGWLKISECLTSSVTPQLQACMLQWVGLKRRPASICQQLT